MSKYILALSFILSLSFLFAQELPEIFPKSPEATEFLKYGISQ